MGSALSHQHSQCGLRAERAAAPPPLIKVASAPSHPSLNVRLYPSPTQPKFGRDEDLEILKAWDISNVDLDVLTGRTVDLSAARMQHMNEYDSFSTNDYGTLTSSRRPEHMARHHKYGLIIFYCEGAKWSLPATMVTHTSATASSPG